MLFGGNYHYPDGFFNNQTRVFEGKEVLLLNPSPTGFVTNFLRMMRTLRLKNSLRGTVRLQEFILLKLSKEERTVEIIKDDQSFHQINIFIKIAKPLLILLRMADSNQPHMVKLQFMVLMVDDHIRMSMTELKNEDYFTPVTELEDDGYEEGPSDDDPPEYLSNDEDVSNNEDGITYQYNKRLGGKILAVWERYKPLLNHDYSRSVYILSVDVKKHAHAKLSILYIYVNYHVTLLQFIILKRIQRCLIYMKENYTSEYHMAMVRVIFRGVVLMHKYKTKLDYFNNDPL